MKILRPNSWQFSLSRRRESPVRSVSNKLGSMNPVDASLPSYPWITVYEPWMGVNEWRCMKGHARGKQWQLKAAVSRA